MKHFTSVVVRQANFGDQAIGCQRSKTFQRRCNLGMVGVGLKVIWEMSTKTYREIIDEIALPPLGYRLRIEIVAFAQLLDRSLRSPLRRRPFGRVKGRAGHTENQGLPYSQMRAGHTALAHWQC